ncbi:unnamed protein product [Owenia fusiformis]|uniref:Adenylate kinase n=1 Tax=Owenia fusiformis TaxID=6347 RepID=A0A8S4P0K4_OWEFU|nr:unnamed protein product [Owenia fusiformis]
MGGPRSREGRIIDYVINVYELTLASIFFVIVGGPGSRKGRIVDDLINVYGFNYLSAEDLILGHLPKKVRNVSKLETTKDICDFVRDDPSHISLEWVLTLIVNHIEANPNGAYLDDPSHISLDWVLTLIVNHIEANPNGAYLDDPSHISLEWVLTLIVNHIEANPNGAYLVDIMPNLKWLMRIETFSKECKDEIKAFEDRFKVSFALNLAIPADKAIKNKEIHCAKHPGANSKLKKEGGQSDEADSGRTQKRAALHEECAKPWLQYFESGQRLVTIDVSCGSADPIWYKVNQLFVELKFRPHRMANTVIIFSFGK